MRESPFNKSSRRWGCYSGFFPKFLYSLILIISFFILGLDGHAQAQTEILDSAQALIDTGMISEANALLESSLFTYPDDMYIIQVLAKGYYWNDQNEKADSLYKEAISNHPQANFLRLDYGLMLYELHELNASKSVLTEYLSEDPENKYALEALVNIDFQRGDLLLATEGCNQLLSLNSDDPQALKTLADLHQITKPRIELGNQYSSDSQPLNSHKLNIGASTYRNRYVQPRLDLSLYRLEGDNGIETSPFFGLANTMSLFHDKTKVELGIGLLDHHDKLITGQVKLEQQLIKRLSLTISAARSPYLYTLSSVGTQVYSNDLNISLDWSDPNGIYAKAYHGQQFFLDDNEIQNSYIWLLSPSFGWEKTKFNIGYSYSLSDAVHSRYTSTDSLTEIIAEFPQDNIAGHYVPYFTPQKQSVHSLIANAKIQFSKKLSLNVKANLAFSANSDIPYLYLDGGGNDDFFLSHDFSTVQASPYEIQARINTQLSKRTSFSVSYTYTENFFYYLDTISLQIRYSFL